MKVCIYEWAITLTSKKQVTHKKVITDQSTVATTVNMVSPSVKCLGHRASERALVLCTFPVLLYTETTKKKLHYKSKIYLGGGKTP